jgi:hypothetical protein
MFTVSTCSIEEKLALLGASPWFTPGHQQFCPFLYLHYQCKYQHNEQGKWWLSTVMKIVLILGTVRGCPTFQAAIPYVIPNWPIIKLKCTIYQVKIMPENPRSFSNKGHWFLKNEFTCQSNCTCIPEASHYIKIYFSSDVICINIWTAFREKNVHWYCLHFLNITVLNYHWKYSQNRTVGGYKMLCFGVVQ